MDLVAMILRINSIHTYTGANITWKITWKCTVLVDGVVVPKYCSNNAYRLENSGDGICMYHMNSRNYFSIRDRWKLLYDFEQL